MQIHLWIVGIADHQGVDVGPLRLGRGFFQCHGTLDGIIAGALTLRINRQIVIWSEGQRDAPMRHGKSGIQLRRAHERTPGFVVIKPVNEVQSLIEKLLRLLVLCRNRMVNVAETRNQSDRGLGIRRRREHGRTETGDKNEDEKVRISPAIKSHSWSSASFAFTAASISEYNFGSSFSTSLAASRPWASWEPL